MKNFPLISIITINLNNEKGLSKTINSIKQQNFIDYELIIIDGDSNDLSKEIIKENERFITLWISEKDEGIYQAMNKGIHLAEGKYCYFLNSGDYFTDANSLSRISPFLKEFEIIYGNVILEKGRSRKITKGFASDQISLFDFYTGTLFHVSAFILRDQFYKDQFYDESLKISSDWTWFVKNIIKNKCKVKYVNQLIAIYDLSGISSSNYQLAQKERESFIEANFGKCVKEDYNRFAEINYKYGRLWENKITSKILHYMNAILWRIEYLFNK
ncbi:MAG: glycosyltransferase family 2 protein [Bacteroidales bacterium]